MLTQTSAEWRTRLVQLLSGTIWGFSTAVDYYAFTASSILGEAGQPNPYESIIVLNVDSERALMQPNLTLGERCMLQFALATTVRLANIPTAAT